MNNSSLLLVYSTTDGHALKIAETISRVVVNKGITVDVISVDDAMDKDLSCHDLILLVASIRYGKHAKRVYEFIDRHLAALQKVPSAFASVSLVARKPGKNNPEGNPYVKKFLRQIAWQPLRVGVFAGKLNYPLYGFWDRQIIRLIMKITGGPTNADAVVECTDWQAVTAFAESVAALHPDRPGFSPEHS